jgi:ABC-type transport system involved in multi-copper enzyme maturation permease subunit
MQLTLIAQNTFRESVRDRVLYNLIFFALLMMGASLFIGELAIGGEEKIIVDIGLSSMRFFGTLIAIFIGIQLVYKEIERRTVYSLLARPVHRSELILGKFGGLGMTLAVNSAVMLCGIVATLLYLERGFTNLIVSVLPAAYLIFLELLVVTAIALTLSTVSSPVLSAVMTFLLYIVGHFSTDFKAMAEQSASPVVSGLLYALYYLLPNFSNFNADRDASYGDLVPASRLLKATVYAAAYCGVLLSTAVFAFQKKDFK